MVARNEWAQAHEALCKLLVALQWHPYTEELQKTTKDFAGRLEKLTRKLGPQAEEVLGFEPVRVCVEDVRDKAYAAAEWLQTEEERRAATQLSMHVKCCAVLARAFDLLEVTLDGRVKRRDTDAASVVASLLSRAGAPSTVAAPHAAWWVQSFGSTRLVVPFDSFFDNFYRSFYAGVTRESREVLKRCLSLVIDYTCDGTVSIYEYGFFLLWTFPDPRDPAPLLLLLHHGAFQPLGDRKSYGLILKKPGDFFIRNTVNQGGGWCFSYLDSHLKSRHVLLGQRWVHNTGAVDHMAPIESPSLSSSSGGSLESSTSTPSDGGPAPTPPSTKNTSTTSPLVAWEFPQATSHSHAAAHTVHALVLQNSDILQTPCGMLALP